MIDWTQMTDVELAVLWCSLHYDDGIFYDTDGEGTEGALTQAADAEAERRDLDGDQLESLADT